MQKRQIYFLLPTAILHVITIWLQRCRFITGWATCTWQLSDEWSSLSTPEHLIAKMYDKSWRSEVWGYRGIFRTLSPLSIFTNSKIQNYHEKSKPVKRLGPFFPVRIDEFSDFWSVSSFKERIKNINYTKTMDNNFDKFAIFVWDDYWYNNELKRVLCSIP